MKKRSLTRCIFLIIIMLIMCDAVNPNILKAQNVKVAAILGSGHNLGGREIGDAVGANELIRVETGTIVVLEATWTIDASRGVSCIDWLILSGKNERFGTNKPKQCKSNRTGPEILGSAMNNVSLAEHALAVSAGKADGTAWIGEFEHKLSQLSEDNERANNTRPEERTPRAPRPTTTRRVRLATGTYTIQQASNGRFVDAHEHSGNDFGIVTREAQNNDTQRWILKPLGNDRYTIQQASNGRYMDAHEDSGNDFRLVTRTAQNNNTQRWIIKSVGNNRYTIQQASTGRYMDAHEHSGNDFHLVTRTAQNNETQRWVIRRTRSTKG